MSHTSPTLDSVAVRKANHGIDPWLWFHVLSLDAPTVALVWQGFCARLLHANVHWPAYVALGVTVWLIYLGDRMLDVLRPHLLFESARHDFYRRYWRIIVPPAVLLFVILLCVNHFLDPVVQRNGVVLGVVVAAYFFVVHAAPKRVQKWFPKELAVGLIFAAGTCMATWTRLSAGRASLIMIGALFFILCWLNCVAIEFWEWEQVRRTSRLVPHPLTAWMGSRLSFLFFAVVIICLGLAINHRFRMFWSAGALSAATLLWLDQQSETLSVDVLRMMADVSLLTPALFIGFV